MLSMQANKCPGPDEFNLMFYFVGVNNDIVGPIILGRGLYQGDMLSPYLFILCSDNYSLIIYR